MAGMRLLGRNMAGWPTVKKASVWLTYAFPLSQGLEIRSAAAYTLPMSEAARTQPQDENAAYAEAVAEGLADAEEGRTIHYEDVRRWLLSWGTDRELPPPECR